MPLQKTLQTLGPRDWGAHPSYVYPAYRSTELRGPKRPLIPIRQTLSELTGPVYGRDAVGALDADLTKNARRNGEPLGERIVVTGRVLGDDGRPVPNALIEIWQCNAAGRYIHAVDQHDAPLDPNFLGAGRCATDEEGRYRFTTIKPGAYPWGNHPNAWRPAHIHFSLFGPSILTRLVTQMYFPGDPLLALDPIYMSAPEGARDLMVSSFALGETKENFALGYIWDIVLRGRAATPMERR
jgi:protocatechuate 3,4-dioxygenase, beta subunit